MTHYAIIKRRKNLLKPEWKEEYNDIKYYYVEKIKYQNKEYKNSSYYATYENVILETESHGDTIIYWEGEVAQEVLNIDEYILLEGDNGFQINKVEKHTDGKITYHINPYSVKAEDYDELLKECEIKYEDYSKQLDVKNKERKIQYTIEKKDSIKNEQYKEQLQNQVPWWERIFG